MATERLSYSPRELARRLGVSPQTVQRWVDAGHLEAWKTPGGHRRIGVDSAERLIQARALACAPAADARGPRPVRPVAVVVDDNAIDRELLAHVVRRTLPGARIACAENGFQGLLLVGRLAPVLVVADVRMPHMNGFEMLRHLAARPGQGPRAVVAVSAHGREDLAGLGALPAGVAFLPKPIDHDRFVAVVRARLDEGQPAAAALA